MKRLLMSMAALVLGLTVSSAAQAAGPGKGGNHGGHNGGHHNGSHHNGHNGHHNGHHNSHFHGSKFSHGYWFNRSFCNWSYYCWSPRYGCNFYWEPTTCCYYYYCAPQACYYPISYISYAPPTATATATANVSQVVNVQNGVGGSAAPQVQGEPPAPPPGAGPVKPYMPPSQ